MSVAFTTTLFDPVYAVLGVEAVLTPSGGSANTITAIDKTRGAEIGDLNIGIMSVRPVAAVRAAELIELSIDRGTLDGGALVLNGVSWVIDAHLEKPTPSGAGDGEVWLILLKGAA